MAERRCAAVGLTGGVASGKSSAAAIFRVRGVPVLDLDAVGRRLASEDVTLRAALADAFGGDILDEEGALRRDRLAARAFASPEATARLNRITHPPIWREAARWLARQRAPYALLEAAVLVEAGWGSRVDAVIAVVAPLALRRTRAGARGLEAARFDAIVARQCGEARHREVADYVIDNGGDLPALEREVDRVHAALEAHFAVSG